MRRHVQLLQCSKKRLRATLIEAMAQHSCGKLGPEASGAGDKHDTSQDGSGQGQLLLRDAKLKVGSAAILPHGSASSTEQIGAASGAGSREVETRPTSERPTEGPVLVSESGTGASGTDLIHSTPEAFTLDESWRLAEEAHKHLVWKTDPLPLLPRLDNRDWHESQTKSRD